MALNVDLRGFWRVLRTPGSWIRVGEFSADWNTELSRLLDQGEPFTDVGTHHAVIGGYRVWIANHPYASFEIGGLIPSRRTALRAGDRLAPLRMAAFRKTTAR